jgi:hypothetical protein
LDNKARRENKGKQGGRLCERGSISDVIVRTSASPPKGGTPYLPRWFGVTLTDARNSARFAWVSCLVGLGCFGHLRPHPRSISHADQKMTSKYVVSTNPVPIEVAAVPTRSTASLLCELAWTRNEGRGGTRPYLHSDQTSAAAPQTHCRRRREESLISPTAGHTPLLVAPTSSWPGVRQSATLDFHARSRQLASSRLIVCATWPETAA